MGHEIPMSLGEIEAEKVFQRSLKLKEKIKDISLGYFKTGDLYPLMKLFGNFTESWMQPGDGDVTQLENRLKEIESGEATFNLHP